MCAPGSPTLYLLANCLYLTWFRMSNSNCSHFDDFLILILSVHACGICRNSTVQDGTVASYDLRTVGLQMQLSRSYCSQRPPLSCVFLFSIIFNLVLGPFCSRGLMVSCGIETRKFTPMQTLIPSATHTQQG